MNNEQQKSHNEKIGRVFAGFVTAGWDEKGKLLSQVKGKDNIVYDELQECGHDGMALLDVGCATGRLLSYVDVKFCDCHLQGIDISEDMVDYARKATASNENQTEIVKGDFLEYDFGENKFDIVVLKFVLHHMLDECMALKKAKQLLKKDGIIIVYTPGKGHFKEVFDEGEYGADLLGRKDSEQIKALFEKCDMEKVEMRLCEFEMKINTFDEFVEFLKRVGSYQKIVQYTDASWDAPFYEKIRKRFCETEWNKGEYILVVYKNSNCRFEREEVCS